MKQKMTINMISVEKFEFKGEDGRDVKMGRVSALSDFENTPTRVGCPVINFSMEIPLFEKFAAIGKFPGLYDVEVELRAGGRGKASLFVVGVSEAKVKS
ncbi:MAG: hypothetical protein HQL75_07260 [Magnetococcales bacterium]|nr:hypothetical protein [Magnetococcales bacterium]